MFGNALKWLIYRDKQRQKDVLLHFCFQYKYVLFLWQVKANS